MSEPAVSEARARVLPFWESVVGGTERLVFDSRLVTWLLAVWWIMFLKDGVGSAPATPIFVKIARAFPGRPPIAPATTYLLSSPIGPAPAHMLDTLTFRSYVALHFCVALLASAVLVVGLNRFGGRVAVGVGTVAFFASPLSNIMFTWLGQQDPFTIGFATASVLFDSPLVMLLAGAGLGISHPEVGLLAVLSVAALRSVDIDRRSVTSGVWLAVGFGFGAAVTVAYEDSAGSGTLAVVSYIHDVGLQNLVRDFLAGFSTWLFTTLGACWFFLGSTGRNVLSKSLSVVVVVVGAVATLITLFVLDETRVFALIVWPSVLWLSVRACRVVPEPLLRRATAITFLLAVAIPRIVVWQGASYVSAWLKV